MTNEIDEKTEVAECCGSSYKISNSSNETTTVTSLFLPYLHYKFQDTMKRNNDWTIRNYEDKSIK